MSDPSALDIPTHTSTPPIPNHSKPKPRARTSSPSKAKANQSLPDPFATIATSTSVAAPHREDTSKTRHPHRSSRQGTEPSASAPDAGPSKTKNTPTRTIPSRSPLPDVFRATPSKPTSSHLSPTMPQARLRKTNPDEGVSYLRSMAPPPSPHFPPVPTPRRPSPSKQASLSVPPKPPTSKATSSSPSLTPFPPMLSQMPTRAEVDATRAQIERRRRGASAQSIGKHSRQHIYAKVVSFYTPIRNWYPSESYACSQHQAKVRDVRKQDRITMQKELFAIKRAKGKGGCTRRPRVTHRDV